MKILKKNSNNILFYSIVSFGEEKSNESTSLVGVNIK